MPPFDHNLWISSAWLSAFLVIGFALGFVIGHWHALSKERRKIQKSQHETLQSLMAVLKSTDKLNAGVEAHNAALAGACQQIQASGETGQSPTRLLNCVVPVLESNRRLENELIAARYQLEQQALKLNENEREVKVDANELGNRKDFDKAMQFAVSQRQTGGPSTALMLIDVDNFKQVNDSFGHNVGDQILVNIGQSLMGCIRPHDQIFRIGGDEFGVLLHDVSEDNISGVAERIRGEVDLREFHVDRDPDSDSAIVTLSMGMTVVELKDTPEQLFVRADQALYHSKEHGRNRLTTKIGNKTQQFVTEASRKPSYEEFKQMAYQGLESLKAR